MEGFGAQNSERLRVPGGCSAKQGNIHFWQKIVFTFQQRLASQYTSEKNLKIGCAGYQQSLFPFYTKTWQNTGRNTRFTFCHPNQNTPHVPQSHITIKKWAKQCNGPKNQRYFKEIISPMRVPIFLWERGKILYPTVVIIGW